MLHNIHLIILHLIALHLITLHLITFDCRQRQEKQSKAFNLLLQKLIELDVWLKCIEDDLSSQTILGSDMTALNSQAEHCRVRRNIAFILYDTKQLIDGVFRNEIL